MGGMVKSLNITVANAIILFEVQRQRQEKGLYNERRLSNKEYERLLFESCYPKIYKQKEEDYPKLNFEGQIIIPK